MTKAYVLLNCELGSEINTIASLKSVNGIKEVHGTLGMYDIIAKIEGASEDQIKQTVTNSIRKMPKIHSTMTLMRAEGEEYFVPSSNSLTGAMLGQNTAQAYVVIHSDKGEEWNILKNLSHIPEVKEADVIFGLYDVICKVETSTHSDLERILTKLIRKLPHVRTTMSLHVISEQEQN